jgi:hypothetical protein
VGEDGRRLAMGKAGIHFRKLEDLPLDVIGEVIRRLPANVYIEQYERAKSCPRNDLTPG